MHPCLTPLSILKLPSNPMSAFCFTCITWSKATVPDTELLKGFKIHKTDATVAGTLLPFAQLFNTRSAVSLLSLSLKRNMQNLTTQFVLWPWQLNSSAAQTHCKEMVWRIVWSPCNTLQQQKKLHKLLIIQCKLIGQIFKLNMLHW